MYKVLIAEDEVLTRAGIVATVDWESLGLRLVAQASDGLQALQMFRALQPDIVITDLNMPQLGGTELIAAIHAEKPACKILVVTCINDVSVIAGLFPYHIFDFLLKSAISTPDLSGRLLAAKRELDNAGTTPAADLAEKDDDAVLAEYLSGRSEYYPFRFSRFALLFRVKKRSPNQNLLVKTIADLLAEYLGPFTGLACAILEQTDFVVCFTKENIDRETLLARCRLFSDYVLRALNVRLLCNIECCEDGRALRNCCRRYFQLLSGVCAGEDGVFENQTEYFVGRVRRLTEMFRLNLFCEDISDFYLECLYKPLTDCVKKDAADLAGYRAAAVRGFARFCSEYRLYDAGELTALSQRLAQARSFEAICLFCRRKTDEKSSRLCYPLRDQREMQVALDFIRDNCSRKITLDKAAEMVSLSPNYFSSLFKKAMGVSFISYLMNCRISLALTLLGNEKWYLYEIAEQVGIPDLAHFSKTFKNLTGFSPNSWRKLVLAAETEEEA